MKRYFALDRQVLVVAVEGEVKDWAAYIGAVEGNKHSEEVQKVYERGTKLPEQVARILFPDFAKKFRWRP